jgi:hypothetical protein
MQILYSSGIEGFSTPSTRVDHCFYRRLSDMQSLDAQCEQLLLPFQIALRLYTSVRQLHIIFCSFPFLSAVVPRMECKRYPNAVQTLSKRYPNASDLSIVNGMQTPAISQ